jgi:DNA repair protein RecO (recombination protein O)
MRSLKSEGIILKIIPYQDHHRIIQLLTPEHGFMSLLAKGATKPRLQSLLSPFTHLEFVYIKKSDMGFFKEGFSLEKHHFLREKWSLLEAAGKMGNALLHTQLPEKPAPLLYQLLLTSFKQLPLFKSASTLVVLFYLKLLTHEGVISWKSPSHFPLPMPLRIWEKLKNIAMTTTFSPFYEDTETAQLEEEIRKIVMGLL